MTDTDAATITTLLEELKEVDFETWNTITIRCRFIETSYATEFGQDFIQGCIQRAIEVRVWDWHVQCPGAATYLAEIIIIDWKNQVGYPVTQYGDTPAVAILAAYIEAVRARQ